MGNIATKATRRYPPSTLVNHPSATQTRASNPFPLSAQNSQHSPDVHSKRAGTTETESSPTAGMPSGFDPKLAARLNQLGSVTISRNENKSPFKV
jgi:hypothetical protein